MGKGRPNAGLTAGENPGNDRRKRSAALGGVARLEVIGEAVP